MPALPAPVDPRPPVPVQEIGRLCLAADRACACGDLPMLAGIATRLKVLLGPALAADLTELATLCEGDPAPAVAAWTALKDHVYQDTRRGGR